MIISHTAKFIFLKPMKVAGTSLEIALSKHCGPGDILTPFGQKDEEKRSSLGYTGAQNFTVPLADYGPVDWARLALRRKRQKKFFGHARAAEVRAMIPADIWDGYLKISAVRNPYDYAISRYFWEARRDPLPPFRDWLLETPEILLENRRITHIDGVCVAEEMIRYEHFQQDLTRLSERLGLTSNLWEDFQGITTKTSTRPKAPPADASFEGFDAGMALVGLLCREDIARHGYAPAHLQTQIA